MGKPKVLYAISRNDDQPEKLKSLFKKEGIILDVVTDAKKAIKAIQDRTYAAVISGWTFIGQEKTGIDIVEAAVREGIEAVYIYTTAPVDTGKLPEQVQVFKDDPVNQHGPIINAVKTKTTEASSRPGQDSPLSRIVTGLISSLRT